VDPTNSFRCIGTGKDATFLQGDEPISGVDISVADEESWYVGEHINGKRHGVGMCLLKNGNLYQGDFKSNLKHGIGSMTLEDEGGRYDGYFFEDLSHGPGQFVLQDGTVYSGQFENGLPHGHCIYQSAPSLVLSSAADPDRMESHINTYMGQFKEGKFHGYGVCHYLNGDIYTGEYRLGCRSGYGEYLFDNKHISGSRKQSLSDFGFWENDAFVRSLKNETGEEHKVKENINEANEHMQQALLLNDKMQTTLKKVSIVRKKSAIGCIKVRKRHAANGISLLPIFELNFENSLDSKRESPVENGSKSLQVYHSAVGEGEAETPVEQIESLVNIPHKLQDDSFPEQETEAFHDCEESEERVDTSVENSSSLHAISESASSTSPTMNSCDFNLDEAIKTNNKLSNQLQSKAAKSEQPTSSLSDNVPDFSSLYEVGLKMVGKLPSMDKRKSPKSGLNNVLLSLYQSGQVSTWNETELDSSESAVTVTEGRNQSLSVAPQENEEKWDVEAIQTLLNQTRKLTKLLAQRYRKSYQALGI